MSVRNTILKRRSVRSFTNQAISQEHLNTILDSARQAPSGSNCQPTYIIKIENKETQAAICEHSGYKGEAQKARKQKFIIQAPILLAIVTNPLVRIRLEKWQESYPMEVNKKRYIYAAIRDASICADHLVLQATELGIDSCFMSWFHQEKVKPILNVPEEHYIVSFLALGYHRNIGNLEEKKERKTIDEFVFSEKFTSVKSMLKEKNT